MRARLLLAYCAVSAALFVGGVIETRTEPSHAAPSGPVAAYGFEDGSGTAARDASGTGLTGTVGGATWTTQGKFGGALSFDGVNDKVDIADHAALRFTTGMTLEAWVRPTNVTSWRTVLLKERPGGLSYSLYASGGPPYNAFINTGGGDSGATGPAALPPNAWSHLAATYDGATLRLYLNGSQVATRSVSGSLSASSGVLRIGGNAVWSEWFAGVIDEVRLYNRVLAAAEIQSDMNTPVGPGVDPPEPGHSQSGRWTGPVELGLVAVNMVQLHTGKILMYPGENEGASARLWNPQDNSSRPVPAGYNIFCSGHAQLADGRILVVGGHDNEGGHLGSAQAAIFDPVSETWTSVPSMSQRRWYPSATTLPDGRVLVTSGGKEAFDDIADIPEIYDPATNQWTRLTTARLAFPYYPFSFVLPDGNVLIAGAGEHPAPTRALNVAQQTWTTIDASPIDGGSAAMYRPGKVIKSGTSATTDVNNVPSATTTYVLDATQPGAQWRSTAPMAYRRAYHTLSLLPDGNVIVTGGGVTTEGKDTTAAIYPAEIWSPSSETWSTMAPMTVPRLYHGTALLLPDGRVMVAGSGDSYGGPDQTVAEFFEPPYLFKGVRPTLSGTPGQAQYNTSFGAITNGPASRVTLVRPGAVTHQFDEDARFLDLAFTQSANALTIDAPANPNLAPPGYYMLFVLNAAGVPSSAAFIRLPTPGGGGDVVAPTAPSNLTATGALSRVDLSWTASSDAVGVTGYSVHRSTTAGFVPGAGNKISDTTTPAFADTGRPPGTYYYRVIARDAAGNSSPPSNEATGVALADTTQPTVTMTAPVDGATVSGTTSVAASAADNVGVTAVQFRLDGVDLGSADTSAPYAISWNTAAVSNGSHSLEAVARDAAGNTRSSASVNVTVFNTAPPPAAGLVGAWSFNEGSGISASDKSGQANTGSLSGPTWTTAGRHGGALSFDGINDRVNIADKASLDLTNRMTFEAWVRPSTVTSWRTVVMKERPGGLAYSLYASDGSAPNAHLRIGSADRHATGSGLLPVDTWSHLAASYDGAALRLYLNGTQIASSAMSGNVAVSTGSLRIGGNAVWSEWFAGLIDEVRIYNTVLTPAQIQADMVAPL